MLLEDRVFDHLLLLQNQLMYPLLFLHKPDNPHVLDLGIPHFPKDSLTHIRSPSIDSYDSLNHLSSTCCYPK